MSKATKLWDEWYPQFIAVHKSLGQLVPELSYSMGRWYASVQVERCEQYEGTYFDDIGVRGEGATPLAAVKACIKAGDAYETLPITPIKNAIGPKREYNSIMDATVRPYLLNELEKRRLESAKLSQIMRAGKVIYGQLRARCE